MQFLLVSASIHVSVLFALFVLYRGRDNNASIVLDRSLLAHGVPVVIVARAPLAQTLCIVSTPPANQAKPQLLAQPATSVINSPSTSVVSTPSAKQSPKSAALPMQQTAQASAVKPTNIQAKTTVVKKEKPAAATIAKKEEPKVAPQKQQPVIAKKEESKIMPEKQQQHVAAKKVDEKKSDAPQKIVQQDAVKQQPIAPIAAAQSAIPEKAVSSIAQVLPTAHADQKAQINGAHAPEIDGPIIVAKDYREKTTIKKHLLLQQELVRVWHPPVGIAQECQCQLRVSIGSDGAVRAVHVLDSSGVLMFDVAARSALSSAQLPKWTWGTSIDITFS